MNRDVCKDSSPADLCGVVSARCRRARNCVSRRTKHKAKNQSINQFTLDWLQNSPAALTHVTRVTRVTRSVWEETLFGARALGAE